MGPPRRLTPSVPSVKSPKHVAARRSRPERARAPEAMRSRAERLGWLRVAPAMCAGRQAARAHVVVEHFLDDVCRRPRGWRQGGEHPGGLRECGRAELGRRRRPSRTSSRVWRHPFPARLRRRGVRLTVWLARVTVHDVAMILIEAVRDQEEARAPARWLCGQRLPPYRGARGSARSGGLVQEGFCARGATSGRDCFLVTFL